MSSLIAKPATSSRDQCKESNEAIRFPNYGLVEIIEGDGDEEDVKWCQVSVMTLESLSIHNLFPRMIRQTTIQETFLVQEDEYIFTNMLNSF